MKRCVAAMCLMFLLLAQGTSAFAQASPVGRVTGPDATFFDAFTVGFGERASLLPRDVLVVRRGGRVVGEAVVISSSVRSAIVLPRGIVLRPNDELIFARHAAPVARSSSGPRPLPGAETVFVRERGASESQSKTGAPQEAAPPASYGGGMDGYNGQGWWYSGYGSASSAPPVDASQAVFPGHIQGPVWSGGAPSVWSGGSRR